MSTLHLVDPELRAYLRDWPTLAMSDAALPATRQAVAAMLPPLDPAAAGDIAIEHHTVPNPDGPPVRVVLFRPPPAAAPRPALLHCHAGGYVLGSPELSALSSLRTAQQLGCVVASVDYRLAPETQAPGPVEDCYAVLLWLHGQAESLGVDPARIAVGGESAGGGLAAALALLARDRAEVKLCFQMLIYPMLDDRTAVAQPNPLTGEFIWTHAENAWAWRAYLGQPPGGPGVSPYAAAARAPDLRGLPPTFLAVGALDLFLDENLAYATRLLHAGVPTELIVYPGVYHGFEFAADAGVGRRAEAERRNALHRAFTAASAHP